LYLDSLRYSNGAVKTPALKFPLQIVGVPTVWAVFALPAYGEVVALQSNLKVFLIHARDRDAEVILLIFLIYPSFDRWRGYEHTLGTTIRALSLIRIIHCAPP
jgi:hypothetical protein